NACLESVVNDKCSGDAFVDSPSFASDGQAVSTKRRRLGCAFGAGSVAKTSNPRARKSVAQLAPIAPVPTTAIRRIGLFRDLPPDMNLAVSSSSNLLKEPKWNTLCGGDATLALDHDLASVCPWFINPEAPLFCFGHVIEVMQQREQLGAFGCSGVIECLHRRVQELVGKPAGKLLEYLLGIGTRGQQPASAVELGRTQAIVMFLQRGDHRHDRAPIEPAQKPLCLLRNEHFGFAYRVFA